MGDWCIGNTAVSKTATGGSIPPSPAEAPCEPDRDRAVPHSQARLPHMLEWTVANVERPVIDA